MKKHFIGDFFKNTFTKISSSKYILNLLYIYMCVDPAFRLLDAFPTRWRARILI